MSTTRVCERMKITANGRKITKTPYWRWEKKKVDSDKKRSLRKRTRFLHGDGSDAIYFLHPRLLDVDLRI
jgi:hypothetical protein